MNVLPTFVDAEAPTLDRVVDHIEHIAEIAGIDHVGLGPDFLREYMDAIYPQYEEFIRFGGVDLKQVVPGLARERDLPNLTERLSSAAGRKRTSARCSARTGCACSASRSDGEAGLILGVRVVRSSA